LNHIKREIADSSKAITDFIQKLTFRSSTTIFVRSARILIERRFSTVERGGVIGRLLRPI